MWKCGIATRKTNQRPACLERMWLRQERVSIVVQRSDLVVVAVKEVRENQLTVKCSFVELLDSLDI